MSRPSLYLVVSLLADASHLVDAALKHLLAFGLVGGVEKTAFVVTCLALFIENILHLLTNYKLYSYINKMLNLFDYIQTLKLQCLFKFTLKTRTPTWGVRHRPT